MSYTVDLSSKSLYFLYKNGCIRKEPISPCSTFYLSFEDALWEELRQKPLINKTILLPSFFCTDVSSRLVERGFDVVFYPLDYNLRFLKDEFVKLTSQHSFGFAMIYYPMGMRDSVPSIDWFRKLLGDNTLIIEDFADSLVQEDSISLIDDNHIAIDSVRKLLPIQGARLWSNRHSTAADGLTLYKLRTFFLWNLCRFFGVLYRATHLNWLDNLRWNIFSKHSDLIGTQPQGISGFSFDRYILNFIDVDGFKKLRANSIKSYIESFSTFSFSFPFGLVEIDSSNIEEVRFVIFRGKKSSLGGLSEILEKAGISTDTHFDDSLLGLQYDFLLLPTGGDVTKIVTDKVAKLCFEYCNKPL